MYSTVILVTCGTLVLGLEDDGREARNHFDEGMIALKSGDPLKAAQAFKEATLDAPDWGLAHLQWGIALQLYQPGHPEVLPALTKAAALEPNNARAQFSLGKTYLAKGQPLAAIPCFKRTLALRDTYQDARFLLGRAYADTDQSSYAIAEMTRVLRTNPRHTGAMTSLAQLYEQTGRDQEAEAIFLRLVRLQPRVAYHFIRLARFYERMGDAEKAASARAHVNLVDPRPARRMRPLRGRRAQKEDE